MLRELFAWQAELNRRTGFDAAALREQFDPQTAGEWLNNYIAAASNELEELRDCVDTVITIPNERLLSFVEPGTSLTDAFRLADDVLRHAGMVEGVTYRKQAGIAGGGIDQSRVPAPALRTVRVRVADSPASSDRVNPAGVVTAVGGGRVVPVATGPIGPALPHSSITRRAN